MISRLQRLRLRRVRRQWIDQKEEDEQVELRTIKGNIKSRCVIQNISNYSHALCQWSTCQRDSTNIVRTILILSQRINTCHAITLNVSRYIPAQVTMYRTMAKGKDM